MNVRQRVTRRDQRARTRAEGVFVAGELDGAGDAVFAFQFLDRLARLVRFELPHAGRGQIYRFEFHLGKNFIILLAAETQRTQSFLCLIVT
jgi:hypothetical protein